MEIAEFLQARIAEDERRFDLPEYDVVLNSRGEVSARGEGWVTRGDCPICGAYMFDGTESATEEAWWDHVESAHQRTKRLAECEVKRRLIEFAKVVGGLEEQLIYDRATEYVEPQEERNLLRLLALPYADHPDYDPAWKV